MVAWSVAAVDGPSTSNTARGLTMALRSSEANCSRPQTIVTRDRADDAVDELQPDLTLPQAVEVFLVAVQRQDRLDHGPVQHDGCRERSQSRCRRPMRGFFTGPRAT